MGLVLLSPLRRTRTPPPTTSEAESGATPALAILQEPPFARAGLADRLVAELGVGLGYGFDTTSDDESVHIRDTRKEIGPDPRVT
jgi:hypothetical protein